MVAAPRTEHGACLTLRLCLWKDFSFLLRTSRFNPGNKPLEALQWGLMPLWKSKADGIITRGGGVPAGELVARPRGPGEPWGGCGSSVQRLLGPGGGSIHSVSKGSQAFFVCVVGALQGCLQPRLCDQSCEVLLECPGCGQAGPSLPTRLLGGCPLAPSPLMSVGDCLPCPGCSASFISVPVCIQLSGCAGAVCHCDPELL